jgi:type I restriction enzyme S subunit
MSKALQVPDGWVKGSLSSFTECFSGGTPSRSKSEFYEGSIPWVKSGEVNNRFIYDTEEKISESAIRESSAKLVNPNSILVAMYGATAGKVAVLKVLAATNQAVLAMNPVDSNLCSDFLFWVMEYEAARLMKKVQGAAQPNLSKNLIGNHKVALPPLPEQKAIAALLSTWDEAIEKTERLIQAKEANLKGQIQKLISQRCDSWPHIKPKKIFDTITEKNFPDEELLSVTQDRGVIPRSMLEGRVMSPDGTTASYKLIKRGDFAISLRSFQGGIEYSNYQGIISPAYTVLRPKIELNSDFYRLFFKSYIFIEKYLNLAVIGIRDGKQISIPDFLSIKIPAPPLEEQKEIAETLSVCQHEIDLLKQLADKYKTQKRGLMQKMLTGEWRVKPEIVNQYMEA